MVDSVFSKKYDALVIDSVNFAYRTFKMKEETPLRISKKSVYKNSICNFIDAVESLKNKYLKSDGQIYLLFDNYFSRSDLRSTFMFADRKKLSESYKANRKKESKEFYNSLNFLRYYYLIGPAEYHTIRVDNLEADDLVKPLFMKLNVFKGNTTALMVTTDMDWTRYLCPNSDWLPDLAGVPETCDEFADKMGFKVTESNIILYKSIFGDESDNISALVRKNEKSFNEFKELLNEISYPEELIIISRDKEEAKRNSILERISLNEQDLLVNLQLVSPIPCGVDLISCSMTTGRNADTLYHTVRNAIGLDVSKEFVFGNVRRNRVS